MYIVAKVQAQSIKVQVDKDTTHCYALFTYIEVCKPANQYIHSHEFLKKIAEASKGKSVGFSVAQLTTEHYTVISNMEKETMFLYSKYLLMYLSIPATPKSD